MPLSPTEITRHAERLRDAGHAEAALSFTLAALAENEATPSAPEQPNGTPEQPELLTITDLRRASPEQMQQLEREQPALLAASLRAIAESKAGPRR